MRGQRKTLSNILKNNNFSEFEKQVYAIVAGIPRGKVRSYKWVAAQTGRPNAHRAVGNALNKNLYPKMIPCHRVIKSDGSLGGYAKGTDLKRRLLKREGIDCAGGRCYNLKEYSGT